MRSSPLPKTRKTRTEKTEAASFMLAEFNQTCEFSRQANGRISTTINFYLTAAAILVSGLVFLSQSTKDVRLFVLGATLGCLILLICGLFLADVVIGVEARRTENALTLNWIRRYFVDHDPAIAKYLVLPIATLPEDQSKMLPQASLVHQNLLLFAIVMNSLLAGVITGSLLWLLTTFSMFSLVLSAFAIAAIFLLVTAWFARRSLQARIARTSSPAYFARAITPKAATSASRSR